MQTLNHAKLKDRADHTMYKIHHIQTILLPIISGYYIQLPQHQI